MLEKKKISIICDYDGKLLSFNEECENFFNLKKKEHIRIYNLINITSIFDFIKEFENIKSVDVSNEFECKLINSKNVVLSFKKRFNKFIIITILNKEIFFKKNSFNFIKFFNLVFRTKFTLGSIIPVIFSFFFSLNFFDDKSLHCALLMFFALYFLHVSANLFNDYFDWKSGRDKLNTDYVFSSTGGSRALDLKIISEASVLKLALITLFIVILCGTMLFFIRSYIIIIFGLIGVTCAYFYSAPPIHLASRYGLGELIHIVCLGPLIVAASVYGLTEQILVQNFLIGFPFGFLITCCLLLNEFPDSKFDKISGKNNLAVILGSKKIPYAYLFFLFLAFSTLLAYIIFFDFKIFYFLVFIVLRYILNNISYLFSLDKDRKSVIMCCIFSFNTYLYFFIIITLSTILDLFFFNYPW